MQNRLTIKLTGTETEPGDAKKQIVFLVTTHMEDASGGPRLGAGGLVSAATRASSWAPGASHPRLSVISTAC